MSEHAYMLLFSVLIDGSTYVGNNESSLPTAHLFVVPLTDCIFESWDETCTSHQLYVAFGEDESLLITNLLILNFLGSRAMIYLMEKR